jgi:hypothetical protein
MRPLARADLIYFPQSKAHALISRRGKSLMTLLHGWDGLLEWWKELRDAAETPDVDEVDRRIAEAAAIQNAHLVTWLAENHPGAGNLSDAAKAHLDPAAVRHDEVLACRRSIVDDLSTRDPSNA